MSDQTLRQNLIRLARQDKALRPKLLPLLKQARSDEFFDAKQKKAWHKIAQMAHNYKNGREKEQEKLRQKVKDAKRYGNPTDAEISAWAAEAYEFYMQNLKDTKTLVRLLAPLYDFLLNNEGPWTQSRYYKELKDGLKQLANAKTFKVRESFIHPETLVEDWLYHGSSGMIGAINAGMGIGNIRFDMGIY